MNLAYWPLEYRRQRMKRERAPWYSNIQLAEHGYLLYKEDPNRRGV